MRRALTLVLLCALGLPIRGQQPATRIYQLEEMAWPQIDALDRDRTLVILPIGMLEEHGPHLPIAADTFGVLFEATGVARRVTRTLPQWNVVMMPPIHYGNAGANVIGGKLVHPGTYGIRLSTLRSMVADLAAELAQNRFQWIFVLSGHGAPPHTVAVNEACDFVSQTFGVTALHVSAVFRVDEAIQARGRANLAKHFSSADIASFGLDVHAGVAETSAILAVRPELVQRSFKKLPALSGHTPEELQTIAKAPDWPGYLSAPAKATAAYGRVVEQWWIEGVSDLIVRAARGEDLSKAPRFADQIDPAVAPVLRKALDNEHAFEAKLQEWLARRR